MTGDRGQTGTVGHRSTAGTQRSERVVSILDPTSAAASHVVLGRAAYLRELAIAAGLSVAMPAAVLIGVALFHLGYSLVAAAIIASAINTVTAVPLMVYATLRLNAASLARERCVISPRTHRIYQPLRGPLRWGGHYFAGSTRSRTISGLPGSLAAAMVFAVFALVTEDSMFRYFHIPIGLVLLLQAAVAASLLGTGRKQDQPPM
ncbi:hypothetical protein [Pseudotabrizicola algicola]|uniref:Uncharacterized protein n=1 Tax=Pseudotabrizicola algicola TaxID=2709381 RepID=A0A6B3RR87_9RHOB|nr:hypothetical protein [Pseudotabrizicola algicola]NEX47318.1 hypothetical protein [Pseudotabrizicola algicola]